MQEIDITEFSRAAFDEDPCTSNGGTCQPTTEDCDGGEFVDGECPNQPECIKRCVAAEQP